MKPEIGYVVRCGCCEGPMIFSSKSGDGFLVYTSETLAQIKASEVPGASGLIKVRIEEVKE